MVYTLQSKKNSKPGARILAFLFCLFFSVNRWSPGGTVSSPGSGQACAHAQDSTRRWDSYYWQLLCNYCSVTVVTQTLRILMSHTSLPLCFTSHPKWKHVGPSLSWWFRFHGESHVQCIFLRGISLTVLLFWLVVLYVLVLSVETWKPKLHVQAAAIAACILIKGILPLFSIICIVCHPACKESRVR